MKIGVSLDLVNRPGNGPLSFTPNQLSGCVLWVRGDYGITNTPQGVSQWLDRSPAGNHLSQPSTANRPYWVNDSGINGQPGVEFFQVPGSPLFLQRLHNSSLNLAQGTILAVARNITPNKEVFLLHKGSYGIAWNYGMSINTIFTGVNFFHHSNVRVLHNGEAGTGIGKGMITTFNAASWYSYLATATNVFEASEVVAMSLVTNNLRLTVGTTLVSNLPQVPYYSYGIICELALYNRILTYPEILSLAEYISNTYALASVI